MDKIFNDKVEESTQELKKIIEEEEALEVDLNYIDDFKIRLQNILAKVEEEEEDKE
jgi:hypothetical protein